MVKLSVNVSDELYKKIHIKILELSAGSTYGKSQVFVTFAIEHLLGELNGDTEVARQLKKVLEQPVRRTASSKLGMVTPR